MMRGGCWAATSTASCGVCICLVCVFGFSRTAIAAGVGSWAVGERRLWVWPIVRAVLMVDGRSRSGDAAVGS